VAEKNQIKKTGLVTEALPNTNFRVVLDEGQEVLAHLAGRLRINRIRVLVGDKVTVEMTPYDNRRGRIVFRENNSSFPPRIRR
jgi:translation initiation factor IF-1